MLSINESVKLQQRDEYGALSFSPRGVQVCAPVSHHLLVDLRWVGSGR